MAHSIQRERVLRRRQPRDVLPTSTVAHQFLLLPHLEESLLPHSSRRAPGQRPHARPPVQSQGHQDAARRDSVVRLLLAATVRHHHSHQARRPYHPRDRRVAHLQLSALRTVARRQ